MGGAPMKPHRATMVLVFGILGFCCIIFAILAWVFGKSDLKEMQAGRMDPSGEGTTKVGMILGIVFTILQVISIVLNIIMMIAGVGAVWSMN